MSFPMSPTLEPELIRRFYVIIITGQKVLPVLIVLSSYIKVQMIYYIM